MRAPNKIYVEVCEDGIFAFPEPPFKESVEYIRADLVGQSLQQEQPEVDLEKEIHKKVLELHTAPCYDELARFARHFAKWGAEHLKN